VYRVGTHPRPRVRPSAVPWGRHDRTDRGVHGASARQRSPRPARGPGPLNRRLPPRAGGPPPPVIGAGGGHPVRHDTTQGIGAAGCHEAARQAAGRLPPRGPPRPAPRPTPWSATPSIGRALGSWTGSLHPAYMTLPRTRGRAAQCAS